MTCLFGLFPCLSIHDYVLLGAGKSPLALPLFICFVHLFTCSSLNQPSCIFTSRHSQADISITSRLVSLLPFPLSALHFPPPDRIVASSFPLPLYLTLPFSFAPSKTRHPVTYFLPHVSLRFLSTSPCLSFPSHL